MWVPNLSLHFAFCRAYLLFSASDRGCIFRHANVAQHSARLHMVWPLTIEPPVQLMSNLDWPNAKEEIKVAVDHLGKNGKKVGAQHVCCIWALLTGACASVDPQSVC